MRQLRFSFFLSLAVVAAPVTAASAEDWPMAGRSASRNPVSVEKKAPLWWHAPDWEDVGTLPSRNIKWQAKLGSHTKGDPIVANGLVWVGTNNRHPHGPQVKEQLPALICFRETDGKFLYQYVTQLGHDERLHDSR
jgi:hypothetical protein